MKTKIILTTLFALFILTANHTYASEPRRDRLTSEIETEYGKKIEVIYFIEGSNYVNKKWITKVDKEGRYLERELYNWNSYRGWEAKTKITYSYDDNNLLMSMSSNDWNSKTKEWDKNTKTIDYKYDNNGFQYIANVAPTKK